MKRRSWPSVSSVGLVGSQLQGEMHLFPSQLRRFRSRDSNWVETLENDYYTPYKVVAAQGQVALVYILNVGLA
jgi:hypothetical protein